MAGRAGGRRGPTARGTAAGQRQDAGNKQWRVLRLKPPPAGQETSEASRSIAALNAMTFGGRSVVADPHADAAEEDLARVLEQQIGLPDTLARVIVEDGVHAGAENYQAPSLQLPAAQPHGLPLRSPHRRANNS